MLKRTFNFTLVFIGIVLFGFITMVLSYCIPNQKIKENIVNDLYQSFNVYQILPGSEETTLDVSTDSIILGELITYKKDKSLLENTVEVYGHKGGVEGLKNHVAGKKVEIEDYTRYWHGYLIILKPLFLLFTYSTLKLMQLFFQLILIIVLAKLMKKNNLEKYIIPLLISLFLIHPEAIGMTFQYSSMYNLMLISSIILLKYNEKFNNKNLFSYYFLIVGMLTSFFDFLTYPAVTFGIPIIFYLLLNKKTIKKQILDIIKYGLIWCTGYIGMWFSKWVIASIILNENVISSSLGAVFWRSSADEFTRLDAIKNNIMVYREEGYFYIFLSIIIYYIIKIFKNRNNIKKNNLIKIIPFVLIAIIPFAWYFVISNHSYIHYWMTYRELLIFCLAGTVSLEYLSNKDRSVKNGKKQKS